MLSGKTFLITGSTGRLGCETVARLEELNANVLPLVLNGYPNEIKRVKWNAKSAPIVVNNADDLNKIQKADYVINFHWLVERTLSYTKQVLFEIDYNIHRIAFLWNWLVDKPIQRFINISSIKVFSHLNNNPISADTEPRPVSPYGITKVTAEKFFDSHFSDASFLVTHLRLCAVACFGEHPSQLLSQLFRSAFGNQRIRINANHTTNIISINEVVDLIINAALVSDRSRYILAKPSIPVEMVASKFEEISKRKLNADYVDLSPGITDPIFESDIESLCANWIRYTSLESMIKQTTDQNLIHSNISCDLNAPH